MYKYKVRLKYNTDQNGGSKSYEVIIEYPKRIYAFTDDYSNQGKGRNGILYAAAMKLGLDPLYIDAISDRSKLDSGWYQLTFIGEVVDSTSSTSQSNSKSVSQEEKDSNYAAVVAANRERREEKEAALDRKAERDERKRKMELEEEKIRAEQQAIKRSQRKERADELRSQGKFFLAFIVEFQSAVAVTGALIVIIPLVLFAFHSNQTNKEEAVTQNPALELIDEKNKKDIKTEKVVNGNELKSEANNQVDGAFKDLVGSEYLSKDMGGNELMKFSKNGDDLQVYYSASSPTKWMRMEIDGNAAKLQGVIMVSFPNKPEVKYTLSQISKAGFDVLNPDGKSQHYSQFH